MIIFYQQVILIQLLAIGLINWQNVAALPDIFNLNELNNHCLDSSSDEILLENDAFSQSFLNESYLDRMKKIGIQEINSLLIGNPRSRAPLSGCVVRQWGYQTEEFFKLANQPMNNETRCKLELDDLYNYMQSIGRLATFEDQYNYTSAQSKLYRQLSSFGRLPFGPIHHTHIWIGDYQTCLGLEQTRHCYASYETIQKQPTKRKYPLGYEFIRIGLCMPLSCTSKIAKSKDYLEKIEQLVFFNLITGFNLTDRNYHKVSDIYCPPAKDSEYRQVGRELLSKVLIFIGIVWLISISICTLITTRSNFRQYNNRYSQDWLEAFDMRSKWRSFLHVDRKTRELDVLDIVKAISMIMIVINHIQLPLMQLVRRPGVLTTTNNRGFIFLMQGHHYLTLLLMISSFLVTYVRFHLKKPIQPFEMITKRYLRLIPLYLVAYAIIKQFAFAWNHGPFWDYAVSPQSSMRQCRSESWFIPVLLLSNMVQAQSHCVLAGWYIAIDFQLYCLLALILFIYSKSKLGGRLMAIAGFLISQIYHFWYNQTAKNYSEEQIFVDPTIYGGGFFSTRIWNDYANPISRVGTAYLGVYLADLLNQRSVSLSTQHENNTHMGTDGNCIELNENNGFVETNNQGSSIDNDRRASNEASRAESNFLDGKWPLIAGIFFLAAALLTPALPAEMKLGLYGQYNQGLTYTLNLLFGHIGGFAIFYWLVRSVQDQSLKQNQEYHSGMLGINSCNRSSTWHKIRDSSVWSILSKLNYSVMLVHDPLIKYFIYSSTDYVDIDYLNISIWTTFTMIICYSLSLIVHLSIELPLNHLVLLCFMSRPKKRHVENTRRK